MKNLKQIISSTPLETIFLTSWFEQNGISSKSVHDHKKYGWLDALGRGAFIKKDVQPNIISAISTIQNHTNYNFHVGGKYALEEYHNVKHFVKNNTKLELFTSERRALPQWFQETFKNNYLCFKTSFLPNEISTQEISLNGFSIKISSPERAFLEMLYNVPDKTSTLEAYQILELLVNLRPKLLNELLSSSKSIKVNRLFLYLASKAKHDWFEDLDVSKINLGSGVRSIDTNGVFNKEYNIIINKVGEL